MAMFTSLNPGNLGFSVPLEEALGLARTHGFDALDLPMGELLQLVGQTSAKDVRDRFAAAGVRPGGWGLPVDFRKDDATHQKGLAQLPRHAALAQALGSPWCATW